MKPVLDRDLLDGSVDEPFDFKLRLNVTRSMSFALDTLAAELRLSKSMLVREALRRGLPAVVADVQHLRSLGFRPSRHLAGMLARAPRRGWPLRCAGRGFPEGRPPKSRRCRRLWRTTTDMPGLNVESCAGFTVPHWRRETDSVVRGLGPGLCLAPCRSSPPEAVDILMDGVGIGPGDLFVDLGSGDGSLVASVAERSGCRAVGVEAAGSLVRTSRRSLSPAARRRVSFLHELVGARSLSSATVVYVWLLAGYPAFVHRAVRGAVRSGSLRALVMVGPVVPDVALDEYGPFVDVGVMRPLPLPGVAVDSLETPEPVRVARFAA